MRMERPRVSFCVHHLPLRRGEVHFQRLRRMIYLFRLKSAQLFNRQGYFGSSLTDIMRETGLEKGGIYNHFSSKEQLALEAFDYAYGLVEQRMRLALAGKLNAIERLLAIVSVFEGIVEDPPVAGGCPILNTAIEADDANEALRERARVAMDSWRTTIHRIVNKGIL